LKFTINSYLADLLKTKYSFMQLSLCFTTLDEISIYPHVNISKRKNNISCSK